MSGVIGLVVASFLMGYCVASMRRFWLVGRVIKKTGAMIDRWNPTDPESMTIKDRHIVEARLQVIGEINKLV